MRKYDTKNSVLLCQKGLPKAGLGLQANKQGEMYEKNQWSGKDLV